MANAKVDIVQRHQFADYLNVSNTSVTDYQLMGTGFTSLNESPSAQTQTKKYINEKSSTTTITEYQTQFSFESDFIKSEACIISLYEVGRNHAVGAAAQKDYVRVELWNPVESTVSGETVVSTEEFHARRFLVSVEVSDIQGETDMQITGNLNAVGDPVEGTFNIKTRTFTEADS